MLSREDILAWLAEKDASRLETLYRQADQVRRGNVGDQVHLGGLIEISNYCRRHCLYCGLRLDRKDLPRCRLERQELLQCVSQAVQRGYGTVVLQSGEDLGLEAPWVADLVEYIKANTPLAVTLSLGERSPQELRLWRQAGADRYLLRFETSSLRLYEQIHPSVPGQPSDRIALLGQLREMGYQVGSGMMIGIPGQTCADLADDILLLEKLELDMIGVGPYLPHPQTPLGRQFNLYRPPGQVPNTQEMTCKAIALARLACPWANIPSTTALASLGPGGGRESGLRCGANVIMPNLTPPAYRALYEIYPNKTSTYGSTDSGASLRQMIQSLGRSVGTSRGNSQRPQTPVDMDQ